MTSEKVTGMNYFSHQFLRKEDFNTAQRYHVDRLRQHNRLLHTQGVIEGLAVSKVDDANGSKVRVSVGKAVDGEYREVELANGILARLYLPEHTNPVLAVQEVTPNESGLEVEMKNIGGSGDVYLSIAHDEKADAPSTDPGITGQPTRIIECAKIVAGTQPPSSAQIRLAVVHRNDDKTIKGDLVDERLFATAKLASHSVTSAHIAEADGTTGQKTTEGKGIKAGHIQLGAVGEKHLDQDLLNKINKNAGAVGWVRLPFQPKRYGKKEDAQEFELQITHALCSSDGATGVMEIPVPPLSSKVTGLRIYGTENQGGIRFDLYRAGTSSIDTKIILSGELGAGDQIDETIESEAFQDQELDDFHGLALRIIANGIADIWFIAVRFN